MPNVSLKKNHIRKVVRRISNLFQYHNCLQVRGKDDLDEICNVCSSIKKIFISSLVYPQEE